MSNPRTTGLLLLLTGVLVLMGNTMDVLPPEAFWAGLMTYPIGGYLFFMGSRRALEQAEARTARRLNPRLGNAAGEAHANRQAAGTNPKAPRKVAMSEVIDSFGNVPEEQLSAQAGPGEDTTETDTREFKVDTDVSFPVELQEEEKPADPLQKLSKLHEQGIISAEELSIAKAKLLG
jgi:hypothetical protein